uniref:Protein BANP n=1 Tax=Timema shepardi TaxID=629360 RepID=A0A7R9AMU1_TIMSH|nr:unnamed protein product [Timema shepardi]
MSGEPTSKRIKDRESSYLSILEAIEICSREIADLKLDVRQKFSHIENRVGLVPSSYNRIMKRMEAIENVVKNVSLCENHQHNCCKEVLRRLDAIEGMLNGSDAAVHTGRSKKTDCTSASSVVLVPNQKPAQVTAALGLDSALQVITLNSEADYPDGSWLGDETNPECKVRCPISPAHLLHVNTFCHSAEKMAVTLLDYLFPREVQAISNLSGKGKHGKKQLDPLMIYGIRCHLQHKFNITEHDWYRIKQNMDSKCRTAWRKKVRGLPLGGLNTHSNESSPNHQLHQMFSDSGEPLILTTGSFFDDDVIDEMKTQVIHTFQGDIEVFHATPEQLVRIRETHNVQVLSEDQILPVLQEHAQITGTEDSSQSDDALTQMLTIVTSSGEVSVDVASIASHHTHLVEAQDIIKNMRVLSPKRKNMGSVNLETEFTTSD